MVAFRSEVLSAEEMGFYHGRTHQQLIYPPQPELAAPYIDAWRRGATVKRLLENPFYRDPETA